MSVKVMSWVWDCSRSRGAQRLVLLAIADHANDDGLDAFPSLARLARKTGMTERGVHKAIQALCLLGELQVTAGGGRGRSNRYRVVMLDYETLNDVPSSDGNPERDSRNEILGTTFHERDSMNTATENPEPRSTEPSFNRPKKISSSKRSSPRTRGTRIPDDFAVTPEMRDWAKEHVPELAGQRETEKFINYWRAKAGAGASKLDWVATWRNWMLNAADRLPQGRAPATRPAGNDIDWDAAMRRAEAREQR